MGLIQLLCILRENVAVSVLKRCITKPSHKLFNHHLLLHPNSHAVNFSWGGMCPRINFLLQIWAACLRYTVFSSHALGGRLDTFDHLVPPPNTLTLTLESPGVFKPWHCSPLSTSAVPPAGCVSHVTPSFHSFDFTPRDDIYLLLDIMNSDLLLGWFCGGGFCQLFGYLCFWWDLHRSFIILGNEFGSWVSPSALTYQSTNQLFWSASWFPRSLSSLRFSLVVWPSRRCC